MGLCDHCPCPTPKHPAQEEAGTHTASPTLQSWGFKRSPVIAVSRPWGACSLPKSPDELLASGFPDHGSMPPSASWLGPHLTGLRCLCHIVTGGPASCRLRGHPSLQAQRRCSSASALQSAGPAPPSSSGCRVTAPWGPGLVVSSHSVPVTPRAGRAGDLRGTLAMPSSPGAPSRLSTQAPEARRADGNDVLALSCDRKGLWWPLLAGPGAGPPCSQAGVPLLLNSRRVSSESLSVSINRVEMLV